MSILPSSGATDPLWLTSPQQLEARIAAAARPVDKSDPFAPPPSPTPADEWVAGLARRVGGGPSLTPNKHTPSSLYPLPPLPGPVRRRVRLDAARARLTAALTAVLTHYRGCLAAHAAACARDGAPFDTPWSRVVLGRLRDTGRRVRRGGLTLPFFASRTDPARYVFALSVPPATVPP